MSKKKFASIILTFSMLSLVTFAIAQEPQPITTWTDRPEYAPSETGTLYIVFYNDEDSAVTIEKILVVFDDWRIYENDEWKGNRTLEVNEAVVSKGTYPTSTTFTVPTDGRAVSTNVHIIVQTTELGSIHYYPFITVVETQRYMEQIVTLFTIQVVLMIVCTIIIAATIFLASRRPQITPQKEEKKE